MFSKKDISVFSRTRAKTFIKLNLIACILINIIFLAVKDKGQLLLFLFILKAFAELLFMY